MNKGKGAWISASALGRRLGLSRVTVERARQEFVRWKLLIKGDRGAGRTDEWYAQLPASCRPQGQRLTDDVVERYAELLAERIVPLPGTSLTDDGGWHPRERLESLPHSSHE